VDASSTRYIGALDQGTTSTRFIVFDAAGAVVTQAQKEHKQIFPQAAWVEHDPEEIFARAQEVIAAALAAVKLAPKNLAAMGITNQRETLVVWHKATGKPYHNAIVWQDQRGAALCERVAATGSADAGGAPAPHAAAPATRKDGGAGAAAVGADRFKAKTGLPIVPYFSASKLRWLLDNVPALAADAASGAALFGTIDTYLIWRLTAGAVHATDVSNASRTLLMDIHTLAWDAELLAAWGVPAAMLPRILPSSHVYGTCAPDSPLPGVPIAGVLGDQQAALFGQACFGAGDAKATYGTGCFLLMNTGTAVVASTHGLLSTVAYQLGTAPPVYALEVR
jgi:glycerol kinase